MGEKMTTVKRIVIEYDQPHYSTLPISSAQDYYEWIGYRTAGGRIRLLIKVCVLDSPYREGHRPEYGFVGCDTEHPAFSADTRACAIRNAINAGRDVLMAPTLAELENALLS